MQFHHHGYVSGDPRVQPAAGVGLDRPDELPNEVDVLIVGAGPAGMIAAAQLSQFPGVVTRIVDRRDGRLAIGQADGIQPRSVETFQAFGFAGRIAEEAYRITEMCFWHPDPADPARIVRGERPPDDPDGISEFPHLIVNQARVLDYFAEYMARSPSRMVPDYGYEFRGLVRSDDHVTVTLVRTAGDRAGQEKVVRARYVLGADGARSRVRESIGCTMRGDSAFHAWGVMDVLAVTDFPDIRLKCAIQSGAGGSILLIPREGGHLFRMYVDLGETDPDTHHEVRSTTIDQIVARAQEILRPYTLDVRDVAWHSVYEVGHRLTDRFDDVTAEEAGTRTPRVFIAGDACHTHSAKAGQGMNVSMQDGFNLAWKLGYVLSGRSPESLLATYSAERQVVAQNLIDFDKEWSALMARRPEDADDPGQLAQFYVRTTEFLFGFMTQYAPSMIVAEPTHQALAAGFVVGKRFKSVRVVRVADANPVHLGHEHRADGRWRVYAFADEESSALAAWAEGVAGQIPADVVEVKAVYQQRQAEVDISTVPTLFLPRTGPFDLIDHEQVFATHPDEDIFEQRGVDRRGAVVVVRPDQYVAAVLPLDAPEELVAFFRQHLLTEG
ncbi:FAD-dependent monooxygenase [Cellulomonas rhizosphaerae]|uniref:3-hydroxybenzoate 4-monooxygenase n=1 Tax=Cellulomonas rhizosphaerae TaxID=2293719 RepID=A0A413RP06_9CELL|nr:FAD-dependent monooxygenase [Cellulomonas rhizosphaerae]RHA43644.1 3-hydroxybenzoate 4-monooxygenase [Cellulomonas rhizosphaerae]